MILTLLSGFLGLFGAGMPKIFEYFQSKSDNKFQLEMMKLQIEAQSQGHFQRLEEINTQGDIQSQIAAYDFAKRRNTGIKWIDGFLELLSGIVRPIITFALVGFYVSYKTALFTAAATDALPWSEAMIAIWTPDDFMLLMGVTSFWFGQRAFYRSR